MNAFSSYLLIGSGKVSRHFQHYLQLEGLPYQVWTRQESAEALAHKAANASHILLLISDPAIHEFWNAHSLLSNRVCVHFSGALVSEYIPSAHPLMTFSDAMYDLETYRRIPFVIEKNRVPGHQLLPGLSNPIHEIDAKLKPLYHALCVMSGNFTTLLWEKVAAEFGNSFNLPKEVLGPYLAQVMSNLLNAPAGTSVLTGPLARGDHETIERHLQVLERDPYQDVYRAFVKAAGPSMTKLDSNGDDSNDGDTKPNNNC